MCESWMLYKEAAADLGVSERTIQRLVKKGLLVSVSMTASNGSLRITRESFEAHLDRVRRIAEGRE